MNEVDDEKPESEYANGRYVKTVNMLRMYLEEHVEIGDDLAVINHVLLRRDGTLELHVGDRAVTELYRLKIHESIITDGYEWFPEE